MQPDPIALARALVVLAGLYLLAGALFAPWFVWRGVGRIDPHARDATVGFRLLIIPGVMLLWPLLLRRWRSGRCEPPEERNAHRLAARRRPVPESRA